MKKCILLVLAAVFMAAPAFADTLTFNDLFVCSSQKSGNGASIGCGNWGYINQAYGDSATVNVTYKDLSSNGDSLQWWDGDYNDLQGVVFGGKTDSTSWNRIEFLPTSGNSLMLISFDLGAYYNATMNTQLRILDLATDSVLLDYGVQSIGSGLTHSSFAPGLSSINGLALEWRDSGYNVGIDNIQFSTQSSTQQFTTQNVTTTVPEPASLILSAFGISASFLLKKKMKRA